jgi:mRNA-degrading endonuclease RelE of RelBE toxin-antitoxin system
MNIVLTEKADKDYKKLPLKLQKKVDKQLLFLLNDYRHPSLRTQKMSNHVYEGRVDYHYRFTFEIQEENIIIIAIGPHDEGLGKK